MNYKYLKTIGICAITIFGLLVTNSVSRSSPSVLAQAQNVNNPIQFHSDQVVIRLGLASDLASIAQTYGLSPVPIDQFANQPIFLMRIVDGVPATDKAGILRNDPQRRVTYAEPNELSQAPEGEGRVIWGNGGSSSDYATQWAGAMINLPAAHSVSTGAGITVAVLDTGVDFTHPGLAGRLLPGYDFVDNDSDPSEVGVFGVDPMFGHGTHISGLIALAAPSARIMPLRVLDPNGMGDTWIVAKAIAYAVDPDGDPSTPDGANVINLSMSGVDQSALLKDVIQAVTCTGPPAPPGGSTTASTGGSTGGSSGGSGGGTSGGSSGGPAGGSTSGSTGGPPQGGATSPPSQGGSPTAIPCLVSSRGVVVIAAAGNDAVSAPRYPAANLMAGLISVGATNENDKLASFSNFGSWIMVVAPGQDILSTVPGGGYGVWSGTSMSVPLVAGEAALVLSAFPSLNGPQVCQVIVSATVNIGSPVPHRINVGMALGVNSGSQ